MMMMMIIIIIITIRVPSRNICRLLIYKYFYYFSSNICEFRYDTGSVHFVHRYMLKTKIETPRSWHRIGTRQLIEQQGKSLLTWVILFHRNRRHVT